MSKDVLDTAGKYVRTYDSKTHGKDYGKLADMFANKIGGVVVSSKAAAKEAKKVTAKKTATQKPKATAKKKATK